MNWKCPQCGENNPDSRKLCGLCGEMRPAEKPEEIVVRALSPATPASPALPTPRPQPLPTFGGWDPGRSGEPTNEEKRRLAEEAAAHILGPRAQRAQESNVGCGMYALFIFCLPLSLFVLLLPGGLRNKNAMNVLIVLLTIAVVVEAMSGIFVLRTIMQHLPAIQGAYNVPPD